MVLLSLSFFRVSLDATLPSRRMSFVANSSTASEGSRRCPAMDFSRIDSIIWGGHNEFLNGYGRGH